MKERFKVIPSVYALFVKYGKILMSRRCNTGYCDGYYSLPAGHAEAGETLREAMAREVQEEVGIASRLEDFRLAHILYRMSNIPVPHERVDFFFAVNAWEGEPENQEPDKCDDLLWFPLTALPDNTVPEVRQAIDQFQRGVYYSEIWPSKKI